MKALKQKPKTIIISMVSLLLIIIFLGIFYINWSLKYRNRINPGVKIGSVELSGLTLEEAEEKLAAAASNKETTGILVSYNDKKIFLPSITAATTDLSFPIFIYNREETINNLVEFNYTDSFLSYLKNSISKVFYKNPEMIYSFDAERAKMFIRENLKDVEIAPKNATFKIRKDVGNEVEFQIEPETIGKEIDFNLALNDIENQLKSLEDEEIKLKTITARPTVYAKDLEPLKSEAQNLISRGNLELLASTTATSTWMVKKDVLASWIISDGSADNLKLSLDLNKINDYLKDKIASDIDQEVKLPRYEIKNGKMSSWQIGSDGLKLNLENSALNIKEQYLNQKNNQVGLIIDVVKSEVTEDANNLHIEEILGTGHSNFVGSPTNRRHNIAVGAEAVNGMLIAPGEEFSLVEALGEIDASTGYLPELVIKNNKTIPEYGGGLCQVATTIFRSALESGLPITARQNHSYRVSYYEPAGTDAAVYDPWPDTRFLNDTGNYILIQSRIVKNDIYFDFWGKKDGRIASSSKPVIYNITKPAPTKLIETTDLKPGEKKCTEKAHNGADAYFDYSVTYANGENKSTRFKSHYVPWQEVCLVGKSLASSTPETISTSTPVATSTKTN